VIQEFTGMSMASMKGQILEVLNYFDIPFWTEGKNVSIGSVNVKCPFCVENGKGEDPSNHCGIFYDSALFHCWRCGKKGHLKKLLSKLTGLPEDRCGEIFESGTIYKFDAVDRIKEIFNGSDGSSSNVAEVGEIELPDHFVKITNDLDYPILFDFLRRRKISVDTVIEHGCGVCRIGQYMGRMIVPVYYCGKLVSFQGVDLTGSKVKYKAAKNKINDFLYNYDKVGKKIIITEGILDAWRVGKDAVATFGTHITESQRKLILEKEPEVLVFCWDSDAYWIARKEADFFAPFVDTIAVVSFPAGHDPDSYGRDFGKNALMSLIEGSIIK